MRRLLTGQGLGSQILHDLTGALRKDKARQPSPTAEAPELHMFYEAKNDRKDRCDLTGQFTAMQWRGQCSHLASQRQAR